MKTPYGWVIAFATMIVLFVTNGIIIPGINAYDAALLGEVAGGSRGALKFGGLLTFALAGLGGPLAGELADRFGVKKLMLGGATLLALLLFLYSKVTTLWQLYALHVGFAVVLLTCGLIVAVMIVSAWSTTHRGTAIGIALVGTSLGGMVFPPLLTSWISAVGWRQTFLWEAAFPVCLIALIFFFIREPPLDAAAPGAQASAPNVSGMTYAEALRTPTFWALAFAAMATFYAILGLQGNLFLYLTKDLQIAPVEAGRFFSWLFGAALIGKFVFGLLADRLPQKLVFLANIAVMFGGALLLASMSQALVWPAILLFGLGWGGLYTLVQVLVMSSFGLKAAGKILGTITTFDAIGGGLGIWLTGLIFDQTGSYRVAFLVLAVLVAGAFVAATQIKQPPKVEAS
jgi:MFS family permease